MEVSTLKAATIDLDTGKVISNNVVSRHFPVNISLFSPFKTLNSAFLAQVTGFNSWEEMTRKFAYDAQREKFYYFEADFVKTPSRVDQRDLYLYTVDAATGKGEKKVSPSCAQID